MMSKDSNSKPSKHGLVEFLIGGVVCVVVPALMTAIAPVSWLGFNRVEGRVTAKVQTCVFFVFPYSTRELSDVKKVSTTFKLGELRRKRRGDHEQVRAESEGHVILHGPAKDGADGDEDVISASVSPASLKTVETTIQTYLDDPRQGKLSLFTVANWKFGVIFAIPACLLTVLFVVGWSVWLGQMAAKPFQILKVDEPPDNGDTTTTVE
jgi:hypothetical protein